MENMFIYVKIRCRESIDLVLIRNQISFCCLGLRPHSFTVHSFKISTRMSAQICFYWLILKSLVWLFCICRTHLPFPVLNNWINKSFHLVKTLSRAKRPKFTFDLMVARKLLTVQRRFHGNGTPILFHGTSNTWERPLFPLGTDEVLLLLVLPNISTSSFWTREDRAGFIFICLYFALTYKTGCSFFAVRICCFCLLDRRSTWRCHFGKFGILYMKCLIVKIAD